MRYFYFFLLKYISVCLLVLLLKYSEYFLCKSCRIFLGLLEFIRGSTYLHLLRRLEVALNKEPEQGGHEARSPQVLHGPGPADCPHRGAAGGRVSAAERRPRSCRRRRPLEPPERLAAQPQPAGASQGHPQHVSP